MKRQRGVFERTPGSGVWWIRFADADGKIRYEKIGAYSVAVKAYAKRKSQVIEGRLFERRPDRRFDVYVDDYLKRRESRTKTIRDLRRYGRIWKDAFGAAMMRRITPGQIDATIGRRLEQVSQQTVAHEVGFLRRVLGAAVRDGILERNPCPAFAAPKSGRVRYLTDDEETALLGQLKAPAADMVLFAANTGLRQSEQFGLTWAQIDLQHRLLRLTTSKTGHGRIITLNDKATETLRRRPSKLHDQRVFGVNCHNWQARTFKPAVQRSGIKDFRWHDLRHTFASRLAMAGVDIRTIADLLGHRSIQMTMRYAHLSPGHRMDAVRALNGRLKAPTEAVTETGGSAS